MGSLPGTETCCTGCGRALQVELGVPLLVLDPDALADEVSQATAARASWYDTPHDRQLVGPYRHHLAKRRAWVERTLGQIDKRDVVLDAGCGDGHNLEWLAAATSGEVWGCDRQLDRLARAVGRPGSSGVALADLLDLAVDDESVDVVFCNHVVEHVPDDIGALRELARITRPGGTIILGVPNEGAAMWRMAYAIEPRYRRGTDHVHFYTADEIAARCEQAALAVRHVEHIGWGVPSWSADAVVRRFRIVDDALEQIGRRLIRRQSTSLYLVLSPA